MSEAPQPTALVSAVPPSRPFVGPEELARRAGRPSLLRLGANESAFGPPPAALAAMRSAVERASWYGDPESLELREALARHHGCEPANICVAAGIDDLLGLVVRAYAAPGDVSVATLGSYPTYVYHVRGYGLREATEPYAPDGSVRLEALAERARAERAKLVYLANPDNPSGSFAGAADIARFRESLPGDCLLVLDEAYADFVPAADLLPAAVDPRTIRLRTFSKAFGLAGARIGYALAAPEAVRTLDKIRLLFGVNRVAQAGALAALGARDFVAGVIAEVARGREEYAALASAHGLGSLPSHTNFVCLELGSRARAEAMVEALLRRGVFIRKPGLPPLDGHVRVTVGAVPERAAFAAAFADALAELAAPA